MNTGQRPFLIWTNKHCRSERRGRKDDQRPIDFIDTYLDMATRSVTCVNESILDHGVHTEELLNAALGMHASLANLLPDIEDREQQQRLQDKLNTLTDALRELERKYQSESVAFLAAPDRSDCA